MNIRRCLMVTGILVTGFATLALAQESKGAQSGQVLKSAAKLCKDYLGTSKRIVFPAKAGKNGSRPSSASEFCKIGDGMFEMSSLETLQKGFPEKGIQQFLDEKSRNDYQETLRKRASNGEITLTPFREFCELSGGIFEIYPFEELVKTPNKNGACRFDGMFGKHGSVIDSKTLYEGPSTLKPMAAALWNIQGLCGPKPNQGGGSTKQPVGSSTETSSSAGAKNAK